MGVASNARASCDAPRAGGCLCATARLPRQDPAHHDQEGSDPSERPLGLGALHGCARDAGEPSVIELVKQRLFFFFFSCREGPLLGGISLSLLGEIVGLNRCCVGK